MSVPKKAKLELEVEVSNKMLEYDCSKSVGDTRVDIISELCKRNIEHAIDIIVENADFQSIVRMRQVSKEWKRIVDSYDNPWQMMLMKRLKDNPDFKKAADLFDWTKYITSSDPKHIERVKYIAYMGTYISEKQRILRRSDGEDESALKLELDVDISSSSVKEMGGWLFVCNYDGSQGKRKIMAWDLSRKNLTTDPQKAFVTPLSPYSELFRCQREGYIGCYTSNSENEPWRPLETVAAGCWIHDGSVSDSDSNSSSSSDSDSNSNHSGSDNDSRDSTDDGVNCFIVWDFHTGDILRLVKTGITDISRIGMDTVLSHQFFTAVTQREQYGLYDVSIYDTELDLVRVLCTPDKVSDFFVDDGKIYVMERNLMYRLRYDILPPVESMHDMSGHIFGDRGSGWIGQIFGNLALAYVYAYTAGVRETHYKLFDISDPENPECLVNKGFDRGQNGEMPGLSLIRNGLLLMSDKVVPFPLEDVFSGYRKGIFDAKCAKLEAEVQYTHGSDQKPRKTDGVCYAQQLEPGSSTPTFIVTRQRREKRNGQSNPWLGGTPHLTINVIDLRKVKPKPSEV